MEYRSFSISVQGESHKRKHILMQDFSGHEDGEVKIAVVSDGHGDPNCFRSDRGSKIAVKVCMEGLQTFAEELLEQQERVEALAQDETNILRQLCIGIIGKWSLEILEELDENPISTEELDRCDEGWKQSYQQGKMCNHIYGATLIGILLCKDYLLVVHQGDGRCVLVSKTGEFCEPVPWDEECEGNITTSLCSDNAAARMRVYSQRISETEPIAAVFAGSDGIEDSYSSHEVMYNFYREFCLEAVQNGLETTCRKYKEKELFQISAAGSGDDMSVAGIVNMEVLKAIATDLKNSLEISRNQEIARKARERMRSMERKRAYLEKREKEKKAARCEARACEESAEEKKKKLQEMLQEKIEKSVYFKREQQQEEKRLQGLEEELCRIEKTLFQLNQKYKERKQEFQKNFRAYKMLAGTVIQLFIGEETGERILENLEAEREQLLEMRQERKFFQDHYMELKESTEKKEEQCRDLQNRLQELIVQIQETEKELQQQEILLMECRRAFKNAKEAAEQAEKERSDYEDEYRQYQDLYEKAIQYMETDNLCVLDKR